MEELGLEDSVIVGGRAGIVCGERGLNIKGEGTLVRTFEEVCGDDLTDRILTGLFKLLLPVIVYLFFYVSSAEVCRRISAIRKRKLLIFIIHNLSSLEILGSGRALFDEMVVTAAEQTVPRK